MYTIATREQARELASKYPELSLFADTGHVDPSTFQIVSSLMKQYGFTDTTNHDNLYRIFEYIRTVA